MKPGGLPSFPFILCICEWIFGLNQLESLLRMTDGLLIWDLSEGRPHTGNA